MAEFERMKQEVEAVKATKIHVEQLFKDGFLFRDENGDVNMPANVANFMNTMIGVTTIDVIP